MQAAKANWKIQVLKQEKGSVAYYSTELFVQDLDWNEAALRDQFMEGLSDKVQVELTRVECLTTLQALVTFFLCIDGCLESCYQAWSHRSAAMPHLSHPGSVPPVPSSAPMDSEPMQLGVARP